MALLLSFLAAALISGISLGLLALAVSRLGKSEGLGAALQVLGLLTLKVAVLALGLKWLTAQPWQRVEGSAAGATAAILAIVIWKGKRAFPRKEEENHV